MGFYARSAHPFPKMDEKRFAPCFLKNGVVHPQFKTLVLSCALLRTIILKNACFLKKGVLHPPFQNLCTLLYTLFSHYKPIVLVFNKGTLPNPFQTYQDEIHGQTHSTRFQ